MLVLKRMPPWRIQGRRLYSAAAKSARRDAPATLGEVKLAGIEHVPPELLAAAVADESADNLLQMYEQMQLLRRMEMRADALYKARHIRGMHRVG